MMGRDRMGAAIGRLVDVADQWIEGAPIAGFAAIGACVVAAVLCPMDRFYIAIWPLSALVALTIFRMFQRWRAAPDRRIQNDA